MKINFFHTIFLFSIVTFSVFCQEDVNDPRNEVNPENELLIEAEEKSAKRKRNKKDGIYEPLAPAKAAFYSAVLPGLGQAYTGNYWKIPLVYGAIGGGIYAYTWNNDIYNRFRDAYKRRLAGFKDDEFFGEEDAQGNPTGFTLEQLIDRQRRFKRDQEFALLLTTFAYILNIVDANVSAHLQQFNINEDLSLKPKILIDDHTLRPSYGLSMRLDL